MIQFDCLDSTNRWVREHAAELDPSRLTCVTAKEQTAGYGRRGTPWISPRGNLYATLFFCLPVSEQPRVPSFTQLLALACAQVVEKEGIFLKIKWPNDLFYEGKKCGGILTECFHLENDRLGVAVGLGLNVNVQPVDVDQPAISLGGPFDLDLLLQAIIERFEQHRLTGFEALQAQINERMFIALG